MDVSAILADIQVGDNWCYGLDIWPGVYSCTLIAFNIGGYLI